MSGYIGLLKVELASHTAFLSDGGFLVYDGDTYNSSDSVLGTIQSIEPMSEGKTGEIPALDFSFNIPDVGAITELTNGALQRKTTRLWLAKYDRETGIVIGEPELQFIGQIDQPLVRIGGGENSGEFSVSLSTVPKAEWLFEKDTGNTLSASFHKSIYPGEAGHDNATGLSVATAWGVEGASASGGGGYTGGGSGGTIDRINVVIQ